MEYLNGQSDGQPKQGAPAERQEDRSRRGASAEHHGGQPDGQVEQKPYAEYQNEHPRKRADLPACPVETCVQLIGSKWRLLIMRDLLMNESMRFGELQRSVGKISQKVLTSNLRDMEEAGLVVRRVYPEVPPHVEYSLTQTGKSLKPIIDAMWTWGEQYQALAE